MNPEMQSKQEKDQQKSESAPDRRCGIIMPISAMASYTANHWADVLTIISDAVTEAQFLPNLVSNSDSVSVIHKTIIQNLYESPMVVCDVSGKNPNVMFELGLRLAFDKPTIVIKDNETTYSFDTSPIEHLTYPRDLRFGQILDFKIKLKEKINSTFSASESDANYSTFLKHFGQFTVPKIDAKEVSGQEYIIDELRALRRIVDRSIIRGEPRRKYGPTRAGFLNACMETTPLPAVKDAADYVRKIDGVKSVEIEERSQGHYHIIARGDDNVDFAQIERGLAKLQKPTYTNS